MPTINVDIFYFRLSHRNRKFIVRQLNRINSEEFLIKSIKIKQYLINTKFNWLAAKVKVFMLENHVKI